MSVMAKILVAASYTPSLLNFRGPLIRRFLSLGHEVVTCSPDGDPPTVTELARLGVPHRTYPLQRAGANPMADIGTYRSMKDIIAAEGPTHLLAYTIKPVIYGSLAAAACGVPHIHAIISGLGTSFRAGGPAGRIRLAIVQALYRRALARCESVMFQNPDDLGLFVERSLVAGRIAKLTDGSGIDLGHFPQRPLPSGAPCALLIARFIREKGVGVYAEAARLVRRERSDATFRLVGFFEDHPDAIRPAEVEAWVAQNAIVYVGEIDDVRDELSRCAVYCLPSYYREGVPRSILEALATGRPVITTDAPGCRETVVSGENGWLVPPRDPRALADALLEAFRDPERLVCMGTRSRTLAESRFDVEHVNDDIVGFMSL